MCQVCFLLHELLPITPIAFLAPNSPAAVAFTSPREPWSTRVINSGQQLGNPQHPTGSEPQIICRNTMLWDPPHAIRKSRIPESEMHGIPPDIVSIEETRSLHNVGFSGLRKEMHTLAGKDTNNLKPSINLGAYERICFIIMRFS